MINGRPLNLPSPPSLSALIPQAVSSQQPPPRLALALFPCHIRSRRKGQYLLTGWLISHTTSYNVFCFLSNLLGCSLKTRKTLLSSHLHGLKMAPDNCGPNEFPQWFLGLTSFINFFIHFYVERGPEARYCWGTTPNSPNPYSHGAFLLDNKLLNNKYILWQVIVLLSVLFNRDREYESSEWEASYFFLHEE